MNTSKHTASQELQEEKARQPAASNAPRDADPQAQDADASAAGGANRGSPAAPVMRQFQKTDAESGGKR
jgi:hypothetical protein